MPVLSFPQAELDVSVWIAPGADPAGDPAVWAWTEITGDVRVQSGVTIDVGRGDEAARVDPGKCSLVLDNRSGRYSPRNPLGQWYGQLAKNTPLQVRVDGAEVFTGTVAEWPVRWDKSGNDCWAPLEASGITRRLMQGQSALRSPLYRQLTRYTPAGYWPLEDGSDSASASSGISGGRPATVTDVGFAADDSLPGAETAMKFNSAASGIEGKVLISTGPGFAAMFFIKLAAVPAAKTTLIEWYGTGTVRTWRISGDSTGFWVEGYDAGDTLVTGGPQTIYVVDMTRWVALQLEATVSGGTTSWASIRHQVGDALFYADSGSYSGTPGRISGFAIPGSTGLTDAAFAHVYAGADTLPFVADSFALVSNGYSGELAADRVARLCAEEGVLVDVEAGTSNPMGPQRVATFLDLLRAVEDADLGVLYETGSKLAYKPSGARYNSPVDLALDFDLGHIAEPPEPTDDDQRVRNDWTVKRDGGGEAHAEDPAHIALNGRYDETATVNAETDADLVDHAGWRLHLGVWDELRWPRIALNLARNPGLIPGWLANGRVGARVTIANPPDQVAGEGIDVFVEGFTQTLTPYGWDVELNCSPARPWDVGVLGDAEDRLDTDGASLSASATAAATTLQVATGAGNALWTTDPAEMPFDVRVGGERIRVTAVAGAASPQTFTVTRAVNGISKAHSAGADVRLWAATYVAI